MRKPAPSSLASWMASKRRRASLGQRLVLVHRAGRHRRARRRTAHAAAQLVELRQAELVGAVDDDGVDVGNVQPALDDRRADQYVELALGKGQHDCSELPLRHLAVTHGDARLGHELAQREPQSARCPAPGCARRTPARRGPARAGWPGGSSVSSNSPTMVLIGRRSSGGVSMVLRSRTPVRLMYSVRGIGVAVSVSTSTSARNLLEALLVATRRSAAPRRRSAGPGLLKATSLLSRRCVPMTMSTLPLAKPSMVLLLLGRASGSARASPR